MTSSSSCTEKTDTYAVASSAGIRAIVNLPNFLGVKSVVTPSVARAKKLDVSKVVVWGRKENCALARTYANEEGLPICYLEDGWIRTSSADSHSRRVYSLLVDYEGVYYDCHSPSEIENTLNLDNREFNQLFGEREKNEAIYCRKYLTKNSITKYNFCRDADPAKIGHNDESLVLVIDQTAGDASLINGGMTADGFESMLQAACDENPSARIVVRTHPDVVSGRKTGHLTKMAKRQGLEISAEQDNPVDWIKRSDKVYVGTSQLGYEALLCGVEVHVFGKPFYAGWGLTVDRQKIARRIRNRSIDELFYVCHMRVARYCHPITGQPCSLRECLHHVNLQKHEFQRNSYHFVGSEITLWKRRFLKQFLRSPNGSVRFSSKTPVSAHETRLTWSFRDQKKLTLQKRESETRFEQTVGGAIYRIEDGFLRSKGLGSDYVAPASLVMDGRGIYFDPSKQSDLEYLLEHHNCTVEEIARADRLRKKILSAGVSKYNVNNKIRSTLPGKAKNALLVIGQVADDESIRRGAVDVDTNLSLCEAVREANPNAYILFKPHPDVVSGNRAGHIPENIVKKLVNEVVVDSDIVECFKACNEVHTITSQSGFEALLHGKTVVTYGLPFYAGWGLTHDKHRLDRRTRIRTIDELVHCVLVAYPKYIDIESGEFIGPEELIDLMSEQTDIQKYGSLQLKSSSFNGRMIRKARNIFKAMTY